MATRGRASAKKIEIVERREMAWALRKRGYSFRRIAQALAAQLEVPYSKSQAQRDVDAVMEELQERTVIEASRGRAADLARLDDLLTAWYGPATNWDRPDREAANIVLRVIDARAKLLGLSKQEISLTAAAPLPVALGLADASSEELKQILQNLELALNLSGVGDGIDFKQ